VPAVQALLGRLPILGVCLGHQSIGQALGGRIVRAKRQMHGKASTVTTDQKGLFKGLPPEFSVIRYHSLVIEPASCPPELEVTARSEDGEIMGRAPPRAGRQQGRPWRACSTTRSRSFPNMATRS
jgi:anthranilate synthase component 2